IRNLLLSAAENNKYEIANVATTTSPAFFESGAIPVTGELDSSGEDCQTGIILAPSEFSGPSQVYIADISNPACAVFTPGSPGTWTAPSQIKTLTDSFLAAGASGIAVAQGTHTGVVTGEFGGRFVILGKGCGELLHHRLVGRRAGPVVELVRVAIERADGRDVALLPLAASAQPGSLLGGNRRGVTANS
ncbi:MAG: hypothetical protein ABIS20_09980, partial [Thermoanaerobaculia bacterium]